MRVLDPYRCPRHSGYGALLAAVVINIITLARTKNIVGDCYLYPLIPFHWGTLRHLILRTRKHEQVKSRD